MQPAYALALFADCPTILGYRLRPLSLGHSLILEATRNPFIADLRGDPEDLLLALSVCSRPFAECRQMLQAGTVGRGDRWRAFCAGLRSQRVWQRAQTEWVRYVDAHTAAPDVWEQAEKGNAGLRNQWQYVVHSALCGSVQSIEQSLAVWDLPVGYAVCLAMAKAELRGESNVISQAESDLLGMDL